MEYRSWFLCFRVRVNEVAGLMLVWPDDNFMGGIPEIVECVADEMLELGEEHPQFGPFAVFAESDIANDGLDGVTAQPGCNRGLVGGLRAFHRLRQSLAGRISDRRKGPAHRVDGLRFRRFLILGQELVGARERQRLCRQEYFVIDDAVEQRPKLDFDRRYKESDEGTPEHLGR